MEDRYIIELDGLTKRYGTLTAVDHLDLKIGKGEIFGLLGPNGAGKSTTILMMLGLTEPSAGRATVCGIDATVSPVKVKRKVGYLPDNVGFYDDMTGLENLMYIARLNRLSRKAAREKALQLLERVGLADVAGKKTGKYSRGMIQRLGLADVLIKNPEVIILDEPTLGIDPRGVREFLDLIVGLSREEGLTVLLSSHHLHQVQQVCDRVGLFVSGKLIAEGDIATLSARLFSSEPFIIEAAVDVPAGTTPELPAALILLRERLLGTADIKSVTYEKGTLKISCLRDCSAVIARAIVETGAGLTGLSKKAYGLDDIYQRYFEKQEAV
ncbi:ABC transporter ATP-binding protein [Compostibacter hankyongensis]|uniref:ABC transporter domain-containing protein n=1 Tax=Compostibacter hankyongensis TaxID=1007089 RepID=A0ABP8G252_9BACT